MNGLKRKSPLKTARPHTIPAGVLRFSLLIQGTSLERDTSRNYYCCVEASADPEFRPRYTGGRISKLARAGAAQSTIAIRMIKIMIEEEGCCMNGKVRS